LLDDDTPLEDDLHEFQFELKAMKLGGCRGCSTLSVRCRA
jgi:hypothetical protein